MSDKNISIMEAREKLRTSSVPVNERPGIADIAVIPGDLAKEKGTPWRFRVKSVLRITPKGGVLVEWQPLDACGDSDGSYEAWFPRSVLNSENGAPLPLKEIAIRTSDRRLEEKQAHKEAGNPPAPGTRVVGELDFYVSVHRELGVPEEHQYRVLYEGCSSDAVDESRFPHLAFGRNPKEAGRLMAQKITEAGYQGRLVQKGQ